MEDNWCIFCVSIVCDLPYEKAYAKYYDTKPPIFKRPYAKNNTADVQDIYNQYKDGIPYKEIGLKYNKTANCLRQTVYHYLKKGLIK
jgi:hypothetical protein